MERLSIRIKFASMLMMLVLLSTCSNFGLYKEDSKFEAPMY